MRLEGKIPLITGAGEGIGRGIAMRFAQEGARVGIFDSRAAKCAETAAAIGEAGGSALALRGDVSSARSVDTAVTALAEHFGPPNVLAHIAGVMPGGTIDRT